MKLELYTRDNCSTCEFTKRVLKERNIDFKEYHVGTDVDRKTVLERFPHAKLLPVVIIDDEFIGTKEHLFQYLSNQGSDDTRH